MHPLGNEVWVEEVRKMLNMVDSRRICLAPYINKTLTFTGEVVSVADQLSSSNKASEAGHVTRICVSEVSCKGHDDIRIGHVNVFVKTHIFKSKYKHKVKLGDSVQFQGTVKLYGPHKDRYGVNNPVFV